MEPTAADVMPKAIIRESGPGATPKEQAAKAVGQRVVDKVREGEWRKGIEETQRKKPIEQRAIDRRLDEIGIERDATGKKIRAPGSPEEARFNKAKAAADLAKKLIEGGYNSLNAAEKGKLLTAIEGRIMADSLLSSEYAALSPAGARTPEQTRELERRLADPKFMADLSEEVNGHLNPENKLLSEQEIQDKRDETTAKEQERSQAESAVKGVSRQLSDVDKALREFKRTGVAAMGLKAIELDRLRGIRPTLESEIATFRGRLDTSRTDLENLREERRLSAYGGRGGRPVADINLEISTKTTEIRNAESEISKREQEVRKIGELETQEEGLKEEKARLEAEKKDKELVFKKADIDLAKTQRHLDDLIRVRTNQEEDLAVNLESVFARTADKYINGEIQAVEVKVNAELEEMKKKATDANEQAILDALQNRWFLLGKTKGTPAYRPIDKALVREDFIDLTISGPQLLMEKMLTGKLTNRINPATGVNYTPADAASEAKRLLADKSDASLYKKMEPVVAKQLIRRKILAGGMRKEDFEAIENTPWGTAAITQALAENKARRERMEQMVGEKVINPGFMGKLWTETKKHPWLLLTILGLVALPVMAARSTASDQIIK